MVRQWSVFLTTPTRSNKLDRLLSHTQGMQLNIIRKKMESILSTIIQLRSRKLKLNQQSAPVCAPFLGRRIPMIHQYVFSGYMFVAFEATDQVRWCLVWFWFENPPKPLGNQVDHTSWFLHSNHQPNLVWKDAFILRSLSILFVSSVPLCPQTSPPDSRNSLTIHMTVIPEYFLDIWRFPKMGVPP